MSARMRWSRMVICAVLVTGVLTATGCDSSASVQDRSTQTRVDSHARIPKAEADSAAEYTGPALVDSADPNAVADYWSDPLDSEQEAAERFGVELDVPDKDLEEILAFDKQGTPSRELAFHYATGIQVRVIDMGNSADAAEMAAGEKPDRGLAPFVHEVVVDGHAARTVEHVDVPVRTDANGQIVPGTGIRNGGAKVEWAVGRYLVQVSSSVAPYDQVVALAQLVRVTD